jgi:hypothetical protein
MIVVGAAPILLIAAVVVVLLAALEGFHASIALDESVRPSSAWWRSRAICCCTLKALWAIVWRSHVLVQPTWCHKTLATAVARISRCIVPAGDLMSFKR